MLHIVNLKKLPWQKTGKTNRKAGVVVQTEGLLLWILKNKEKLLVQADALHTVRALLTNGLLKKQGKLAEKAARIPVAAEEDATGVIMKKAEAKLTANGNRQNIAKCIG